MHFLREQFLIIVVDSSLLILDNSNAFSLLYYNFNKTSLNRGGSYIKPAKWVKDKRSIINPKNNDYKCFQYAITVALNRNKINRDPQRISKIKPFTEQ